MGGMEECFGCHLSQKVSLNIKRKIYCVFIRLTMLYGTESWVTKSQQENKINVTEMRMLHLMSGYTRQDRIRNERIGEKIGVAPLVDKMVETCLRWLRHV